MVDLFDYIESKKVVLFGTGAIANNVSNQFTNVAYYVDNSSQKWGNIFKEREIFSPEKLLDEDKDEISIVVASSYYYDISNQLKKMGFQEGKHFFDGMLQELYSFKRGFPRELVVDGIKFANIKLTNSRTNSVGFNEKYIVKIEHDINFNKSNNLENEIKIVSYLNECGCVTCPKLISSGVLDSGERYFIQERIFSEGRPTTADLLLSLIEQKNLGVFHGDLKPENIIFNGTICYLIDYDQAEYNESFKNINNTSFVEFIPHYLNKKYNCKDFLDLFGNYFDKDEMLFLLKGGSLNLAKTTVFRKQCTTLEVDGAYHSLNHNEIYINGARDLKIRSRILDDIYFQPNERILDVGCNMGLLSHYLHDRGCIVTGIDLDPYVIYGAKIVSNILHKKIDFKCIDADTLTEQKVFDTIFMFSVLQHIEDVKKFGKYISGKCNRIIIENGLYEKGIKPKESKWQESTYWNFTSLEELVSFIEDTFIGFKFEKNYGTVDRSRYILSFIKE
ncbi:Ubiquinone biosynthesis O-methyltransferase [compost metagenome]